MNDTLSLIGAKRPRRRGGRRATLLDEAARQINERGAAALNLNDIAETVGLSRNAIYYYVEDRSDLIFRCYLRSCEAMSEDLDHAVECDGSAPRRLIAFIERVLVTRAAPLAVLSDLDFLADPQRSTIADMNRRNIDTLALIVAEGIRAGEFAAVSAPLAAQCLLGMMNWAQLSRIWLNLSDDEASRRHISHSIADLILNGMAAGGNGAVECPLRADQLRVTPFNAFDRTEAGEEKMRQLIDAASRLFNRRGCDGVSLDEISASVGATKGAVYHYFADKPDFVARCYARAFDLYTIYAKAAGEMGETGLAKALRVTHLNCQALASSAPPLMPQPGLFSLPVAVREGLIRRAQAIWALCQDYIAEGVADGSCRPVSAADAAMVGAGAFFWLPKWIPESGAPDPVALADEITGLVRNGLRIRPPG